MCNTLNIKALELYCNIKKWNIELDTLIVCCPCVTFNVFSFRPAKDRPHDIEIVYL